MVTPLGSGRDPASNTRLPAMRDLAVVTMRIVRGMRAHHAVDSARLMAFNFFLSVVPLLVMLGYVLGRFVRKRGVDALVGPLLETIPAPSADLARHELERMAGGGSLSVAPLGLVTFLWLTSSGIHQMMDVFEVAVRAKPRPWWKQRLIALVTVALGVGAMCGTAWLLVRGDDKLHVDDVDTSPPSTKGAIVPAVPKSAEPKGWHPHDLPPPKDVRPLPTLAPVTKKRHLLTRVHAPWERVLAGTAVLLVGVFGLAAFYRFAVEHGAGIRRRAWPGALCAMGAWLTVVVAFRRLPRLAQYLRRLLRRLGRRRRASRVAVPHEPRAPPWR